VNPFPNQSVDRDPLPTMAALARYMRTLYLHVQRCTATRRTRNAGDAGT
jgi:hypothetical protein